MNSREEIDRIVFYSKEDGGATSHNLIKAEKLLSNFDSEQIFTFNDLFEFYNIKLHFDNDLFLTKWNKSDKERYNQIIEKTWATLKDRLIKISDQNIEKILNDLGYNYKKKLLGVNQ
ncbi:hypothetical protein JCM19274_1017 [Algibacter lectus]|uniref:Uncharacterized protein n=1 Tax=Algibacter lectus TaxID=221126 RepID=A0A090WQS8_9FLAO|nr:hypothetical protein [Algibacter lectus]GAL78553.1 hypothetical protein JCM19274_1017 [Algibacter lectus]